MPLHFEREEYARRLDRTCAAMEAAGLDGLLCFKQESMYWLTGFDSPTDSVRRTVAFIRNHPLMPGDILIRGFLMDPETGAVEAVEDEEGGENKR